MDIQSIKKIIFPAVNNAIQQMEEKNLSCNITLLKRIVNEAIDGSLDRNHNHLSNIIADFSGRGRAWAKINVDLNNPVWINIKESLLSEINSSEKNSDIHTHATGLLDLFENTGIAWMRFAGVNNKSKNIRFQLRLWGSKIEDHIKIYIHECDYSFIENLEGVPHSLDLESGNFILDEINKKEKINIDISPDELNSFGILTLEDILGEELNNENQ